MGCMQQAGKDQGRSVLQGIVLIENLAVVIAAIVVVIGRGVFHDVGESLFDQVDKIYIPDNDFTALFDPQVKSTVPRTMGRAGIETVPKCEQEQDRG